MTITFILIGINILIYALPYIIPFGGSMSNSVIIFQNVFAKINSEINDGEFYRLITANFLHGSIVHLGVNMFSLYQVGPAVNSIFSSTGYLMIFLLSGLGGAFASYLFNQNPSVGASGAIFGLVGAILAYALITGNTGLISQIIFITVLNFSISLSPGSRIDNWGHLGGFITGILLGSALLFTRG